MKQPDEMVHLELDMTAEEFLDLTSMVYLGFNNTEGAAIKRCWKVKLKFAEAYLKTMECD